MMLRDLFAKEWVGECPPCLPIHYFLRHCSVYTLFYDLTRDSIANKFVLDAYRFYAKLESY